MTYLVHKDPRYTLAALVFFSVPGDVLDPVDPADIDAVGGGSAIVAVAAVDFVGMSFGLGGIAARVIVALPGAQMSLISSAGA